MRLLVQWVILAISVLAAAWVTKALGLGFESESINGSGFMTLLIGVAILALFNATLGKVLKLLTLPLNCLTFGLFSLVVNAIILIAAASLDLGFHFTVQGFNKFLAAFVAALLISAVNGILNGILLPEKKGDRD